jgi:hypothetical protein
MFFSEKASGTALTSRAAVAVAIHYTRHGGDRVLRAGHKVGALQAMAAGVDHHEVFSLKRRAIDGEEPFSAKSYTF